MIPAIIKAAPKLDALFGVKPYGSKISSIKEPYILNVPFTVPNEIAKDINFLFLNNIPIDFLNSIFCTIEPRLGKVGGLSLKKIIIRTAVIPEIINYTNSNTKK
jgi:hypothetical protein